MSLMTHLAIVSSRGGIQSTDRWTDADPDFRKWKPQGCDLSYLWKRCGHASDSGGSAGRTCCILRGFLGKPEISRGNRNYENYFVNGRYVKSKIIAKGIEDGYKSFMMQHQVSFCVSGYFRLMATMLDVNVHPTKMELRFSNQNLVYDLLERMTKDALSGRELIPEVTLDDTGARNPWQRRTSESDRSMMPSGMPEQCGYRAIARRSHSGQWSSEQPMQRNRPESRPVAAAPQAVCTGRGGAGQKGFRWKRLWTTPEPMPTKEPAQAHRLRIWNTLWNRCANGWRSVIVRRQRRPAAAEQTQATETAQSTVPERSSH